MKKFPKTLYVRIEDEDVDLYFIAVEELAGLAEIGTKTRVGVYELKEVGAVTGAVEYRK